MKLNWDFLAGWIMAWVYLEFARPWLRAKWRARKWAKACPCGDAGCDRTADRESAP